MDLKSVPVRISYMTSLLWRRLSAMLLAAGLLASVAVLTTAPGWADVGVEKVSPSAGAAGDAVNLMLGCGSCYPPCQRAAGHRSGSCMPGTKASPPASLPISLVPIEKAPKPHRCGPDAICPPQASEPPRQSPFTFLGRATPPRDGDSPQHPDDNHVPRYLLHFRIPDLQPGIYTFVIYCDVCLRGKGGSLITDPTARAWRLRVRPR